MISHNVIDAAKEVGKRGHQGSAVHFVVIWKVSAGRETHLRR